MIGAGLSLDTSQLTAAAQSTFKHAASMANPKFYERQRLRKSTWDTPKFVRGYDITVDDRLVRTRGLRHIVARIVERAGARLTVTDVRNSGGEIEVAFMAELDTKQGVAVSVMLAHDTSRRSVSSNWCGNTILSGNGLVSYQNQYSGLADEYESFCDTPTQGTF